MKSKLSLQLFSQLRGGNHGDRSVYIDACLLAQSVTNPAACVTSVAQIFPSLCPRRALHLLRCVVFHNDLHQTPVNIHQLLPLQQRGVPGPYAQVPLQVQARSCRSSISEENGHVKGACSPVFGECTELPARIVLVVSLYLP